MGFHTFGPLLVVDTNMRPVAGVVGSVIDAETDAPVTVYTMDGAEQNLATTALGYVGQFQAPDTARMLRVTFGGMVLDVVAKEVILDGGGGGVAGVTSVDGQTGAVSLSSTYAPVLGADDNYVTDAEKLALHTHPAVIAQGATAADARTAIGAGTSSFTGDYADLTGKPTLGTAAATAATDYATAAQGAKADTALQVGTPVPIVALTGAQTTGATHAGKDLHITASSGVDLTVQTAPAGSIIQVRQSGAGALTCVGDGVTLTPMPGMTLVSGGLGARFAIVYTSTTTADVLGWMVPA